MQTLKTAAIVVLMMTVLYGAYVSMTTPPDPLPPEIIPMMVESGEFEISDGLPESFADLQDLDEVGINDGVASTKTNSPSTTMEISHTDGDPSDMTAKTIPEALSLNGPASLDAANRTFADLPRRSAETPSSSKTESGTSSDEATSFSLSDQTDEALRRLPPVGSSASDIRVDETREYPSTGGTFSLPDPSLVPSSVPVANAANGNSSNTDAMAGGAGASTASAALNTAAAGLENAIATADRQYAADRRREALATLSLFYETPNLTPAQREKLLARLDPLASEVVYSREHLLDKPHRVGPNETLMDIAKRYDVPWQLLANINGIEDPVTVLPGRDLKVVRGPFRADIDLKNKELTMFAGDLYAGRFPIEIGSDPTPKPGTYTIQEKQASKTYYDMAGTPIPPDNPRNPYGSMWIDLGSGISLHGSPLPDRPTNQGCISVAGDYSRDVFGILSEGSSVTIR